MKENPTNSRRRFLTRSALGTAGFMVLRTQTALGAAANSAITVGILGCGGRGHYIAKMMDQHGGGNLKVTALQDPFEDRVNSLRDAFDIPQENCFVGIQSYQDLLERTNVDAVAVTSPPYFHPQQVEAAVNADKHIWLAKPVAVDVPGCQSILESAKKSQDKKTFLVDFQTRNNPNYIECIKRVHAGEIGEPVLGHIYYHTGRLGRKDQPGMSEDEARLRNWVFDIQLSGDIIVEQNIHVLDVANWYLKDQHPLKAVGTGGRKARTDVGDCWDHFIVTYTYPNEVRIDFSSGQFIKGFDDMCTRLYGTRGTADAHYFGSIEITGDNPWPGVKQQDTMDIGVTRNVKDFAASIQSGQFVNHGDYSVNSTLTSILGRMAAYAGAEVTWDEMMKKAEKFEVNLTL